MTEPVDRWEPWQPVELLVVGPDTVLCEDPPPELPVSRPAGFAATLD